MDSADVQEMFADLFQGNQTRYGTEEGGSVVIDTFDWDEIVEFHLNGTTEPVGVYPIDPETGMCRWGCIDFDEGDEVSLIHARNVERFLECEGIVSWIERSRSKGYHLWVFANDWLPPSVMRNALLYACEFMQAPTKEINPKQTELSPGEVGNYVRLPYPGGYDNRRVAVVFNESVEGPLNVPLDEFVETAWQTRTNPNALIKLSQRYKPKPRVRKITYTVVDDESGDTDELLERLSHDARRLFDNGPRNADRSSTLCALAGCIARDRTLEPAEARAVLTKADEHWGKYADRGDAELRLDEIIDRAYGDLDSAY